MSLLDHITSHEDWPTAGITFRDLNPIYRDPALMAEAAEAIAAVARGLGPAPALIVAPEARGFILGPMLARELGAGFVPVRKPAKLPPPVHAHEYELEYGLDTLEMQSHPLAGAGPVLVYDDVLATGGTAAAAGSLVRALAGELAGFAFLLELEDLPGRERLAADHPGVAAAAALSV